MLTGPEGVTHTEGSSGAQRECPASVNGSRWQGTGGRRCPLRRARSLVCMGRCSWVLSSENGDWDKPEVLPARPPALAAGSLFRKRLSKCAAWILVSLLSKWLSGLKPEPSGACLTFFSHRPQQILLAVPPHAPRVRRPLPVSTPGPLSWLAGPPTPFLTSFQPVRTCSPSIISYEEIVMKPRPC